MYVIIMYININRLSEFVFNFMENFIFCWIVLEIFLNYISNKYQYVVNGFSSKPKDKVLLLTSNVDVFINESETKIKKNYAYVNVGDRLRFRSVSENVHTVNIQDESKFYIKVNVGKSFDSFEVCNKNNIIKVYTKLNFLSDFFRYFFFITVIVTLIVLILFEVNIIETLS